MEKFDLENFPVSESAKNMIASVSDGFYDNSYVGKWLYEVMGQEYDTAREIAEDILNQLFPETATWGLMYHEIKWGLPVRENLPYEERRQLIYRKRDYRAPMTPYRMEGYLKTATGFDVRIADINDPGDYGFVAPHPNVFKAYFMGEGTLALMEKERQDGYQLTLTDMYELEKIKDIKARNKILKESTDSRDLARRAINAQKEQKRQENMKLYVAMMKKLGLKKAPAEADSEFYTDKWERMESYSLDKEPPKTMKFKDNGEPMFYLERYGTLYVIRKAKKAKKVLTPEEEAKKQNMRNKKQIKAILKEAANTRKVFIEGILSGRIKKVTDEKQVEADLFEQMMDWETFTGHNKLIEFFVGCEVYNAPEEEKEAAHKKMQGLSVLQKLLCLVSAMVADADLVEWNYTYNTVRGEKVKAFYGILEQYGFQFPNDEEKGVVEGTSDLYVKKEGAK